MKEIFKRIFIVIHSIIFISGILFTIYGYKNLENNHGDYFLYGIGLLILGSILKYIFFGKFLFFPWSK